MSRGGAATAPAGERRCVLGLALLALAHHVQRLLLVLQLLV
jgi:hypothetical protein